MKKNWKSRWLMRQIVLALSEATNHGLKQEVVNFASTLEATSLMARGLKKDADVTFSCKREELDAFITYMVRLHSSKISLLHRARIGLATLALKDTTVLGEDPFEFIKREFPKAKSSKNEGIQIAQSTKGVRRG